MTKIGFPHKIYVKKQTFNVNNKDIGTTGKSSLNATSVTDFRCFSLHYFENFLLADTENIFLDLLDFAMCHRIIGLQPCGTNY